MHDVKTRIITMVGLGGVVFSLLFMGLVFYWSNRKYDVLTFKQDHIPVQTHQVKQGTFVILNFDFCKNNNAEGDVTWYMVSNKTEIKLPNYIDELKPGCRQLTAPVALPPQVAPDRYYIRYEITYKVNPIKEVLDVVRTEEFEVIGE